MPVRIRAYTSDTAEVRVNRGSMWIILAPPPRPIPRRGSSFAFRNHWKPTGCASAGFAPLMMMTSAF